MRLAVLAACLFLSSAAPAAEAPINHAAQFNVLQEGQRLARVGAWQKAVAEFDKAIAAYEAAYKDSPAKVYAAATDDQARALLAEAKAKGRPAIDVGSYWADAYTFKGIALMRGGQFKEAETAFRRAVELSPYHAAVRLELAFSLVRQERWAESLAPYRAAQDLARAWLTDRNRASLLNRALRGEGIALARLGYDEPATKALEQALEFDPDDEGSLQELERIDRRLGR